MAIASHASIFFSSGTALISESNRIASQRQSCQERPSLRFKGTAKFILRATGAVYICNGGRIKVDKKALLEVGFLSCLDSRTNQTQAFFLGNTNGPPFTSFHGELRAMDRQTERPPGRRCVTINAHGSSRRLRFLSVIMLSSSLKPSQSTVLLLYSLPLHHARSVHTHGAQRL